ncbi:MinD/ParA family protein [Aeromicrobium sp. CF4.19]|uniref:MinD/ParA family ATP-binding protein n=1 Tax=Aeromicrobium sp. CF4.19 TaxID=3373082 RepID=UPI003EE4CC93
MSDDEQRPGDESEPAPDLAAVRRRQAQGSASDLARMGIDPRSLGLAEDQDPETIESRPTEPQDDAGSASVVPLRPGLGGSSDQPLLSPAGPSGPSPEQTTAEPAQTSRPSTTVEQLLSRTAASTRPPRQAGRLLRAVTRGLVTADAAESVLGDREVVEAVRHRQSDRRVVAFMAGKGGVGCTTTAVGAGTCFAAMREDRSAVVDVQQGSVPLSAVLGASTGLDLTGVAGLDTDTPIPTAVSGLGLVDAVEWDLSTTRRDVGGALERLGADHTFALLDAGDSPGEAAHAAVARADQVVIVTSAGGLGLSALEVALDRARSINPAAAERAVHVVVCPHEEAYRTVHREVVSRLGQQPAAIVVVPPDPHLAQGQPYDPARVSATTREAFVRVAAAIALGGSR